MPSSPSPTRPGPGSGSASPIAPDDTFPSTSLLADLDPESRQAILALMPETTEPAGTVLLAQGRPNDRLFVLVEGQVAFQRTHPDGRTEAVAHLSAPAAFGTTSFFRPVPPATTALASTPVRLLTLDRASHERLRRESPAAAEALALAAVRILSERFDLLLDRVEDHLQRHPEPPNRPSEWGRFRTRLFEEPGV